MYEVGVFPGKFAPPHRGHINSIIQSSTKCKELYVVVSHNDALESHLYEETGCKPITLNEKIKWLSIEFSDLEHIKVLALDENDIPAYPNGWAKWSKRLREVVGKPIDVIFGGEPEYAKDGYTKYFPEAVYELYDINRTLYPISATEIRRNMFQHWEYILGVARPYFAKRVLLSGSESCGKSTLTKMLAKVFFTSWAREEGRYYSTNNFGGNETVFSKQDFFNICWEQRKTEEMALRTANRIVFFDTDAVVTQYYCKLYLGEENKDIETLIDESRYDVIFFMQPDVPWVADGFRWNSEDKQRWKLHNELKQMYIDRGFGDKIIEIGGSYNERLTKTFEISKRLINE